MTRLPRLSTDAGLAAALDERVRLTPRESAATSWSGTRWTTEDWTQVRSRVLALSDAMRAGGLGPGEHVGLYMKTDYAWMLTDYAAQVIGAVSVVFHPGWSAEELDQALEIATPSIIVCGADESSMLRTALARSGGDARIWEHAHKAVDDEFWQLTQATVDRSVAGDTADANAVATIVFTSGTSGRLKAVALTHSSLLGASAQAYDHLGFDGRGCSSLHWLPLSHMFGRIGLYLDLLVGGHGHFGRGQEHFAEDVRQAKPAVLFAVPIALRRLRHRINTSLAVQPPSKRRMSRLAMKLGRAAAWTRPGLRLPMQRFLRDRVFRTLHQAIGGNLAVIVVGGAPVDATDKQFFETFGIAVREGYGLTESSGVVALQSLKRPFSGAGRLLPDLEARVGHDGELLLRGKPMLKGYLNGAAFDDAGWFHTGDRCHVDRRGSVTVTGRIKDVIIPSTGENVDPTKLEALILRDPTVTDACVVGDGRPCLIAIIVVNPSAAASLEATSATVRLHLDVVNSKLSSFEQIRGFIYADEFSTSTGELTVTAKKRRDIIQSKHAIEIEACYERMRLSRVNQTREWG